jgi:RNA polymerase sigma factor (sigma-70 family)
MEAFQELYERYYPDVYRFALFLTGDTGRAEDLAADTFVRAWIARDRINLTTVKAYLLTIAKNLYRDQRRRERPVAEVPEIADEIRDPRPAVDVQVGHVMDLGRVRARLRHVPRGDRQAFLMFIVRGMSQREIADALGVTIGAVKSRIFRAREALTNSAPPAVRNGEST